MTGSRTGPVDLGDEARAARNLEREVESAWRRLDVKAGQLKQRAGRARAGSHERKVCMALASRLDACKAVLKHRTDFQRRLHEEGVLVDAGWRLLAARIGSLWRERSTPEAAAVSDVVCRPDATEKEQAA